MIVFLVALAAAVLFAGPAAPMALRAAKAQRAKREEERQRRELEAAEAKRQGERIWEEEPGNAVLRERLMFESQARLPLEHAANEAELQVGQLDGAIQRHESSFNKGSGGRPGLAYQIVVVGLLGLAVVVFVLGAILDYLIFRGLHPGGSVLIPAGLAGVVIIAVMVGSFVAISAKRHGLIPPEWNEYFTYFARVFGALLAIGAVICMIYYAPARSYLADEPHIVTDQAAVAQLRHAVAPDAATQQANAAALQAAEATLASDQATLHKAQQLDRVMAGILGTLEIPLTEAAVLGGALIAFRMLLRRRDQAGQDHREASSNLDQAEARFTAVTNATLMEHGHDHRAYGEGLARLRELGYFLKLHANGGQPPGAAPGAPGGPGSLGAGSAQGPQGPAPGGPGAAGPRVVPGAVVGSPQQPQAPASPPAPPGPGAGGLQGTQGATVPVVPTIPLQTVVPPAPIIPVASPGQGGPVTTLPSTEFDETE
jgi:hypothetical protein